METAMATTMATTAFTTVHPDLLAAHRRGGLESTGAAARAALGALRGWGFDAARRCWYGTRRLWWKGYWSLTVDGLDHLPRRGPVLLCANHTSHLDAAAILAALPRDVALRTRTAAAKDVFGDYPWRDFASRLTTNALPIQRGADFARGLRTLEAVLVERQPLILFPEGRRSADGRMVEFKPGAAMLACRTKTPIVPIRIDGADEALPRGSSLPARAAVRVRFGEAIDPRPYCEAVADRRIDRRESYDRMTADLKAAVAALAD